MTLPDSLGRTLAQAIAQPLTDDVPVGGGDICRAWQLTTADGGRYFVKHHPRPPPGMFEAEAEGLTAMAATGAIRTPAVIARGEDFLLLELIAAGNPGGDFWRLLGRQLAVMHSHTAPAFGFHRDNYIGLTPQPNPRCDDGFLFFQKHRLGFQGRLARERGQLTNDELDRIERLATRLPELVPAQPASLLHGDLWGGNFLCARGGEPVLIDPATHYGWAEAELAFTTLFGGFEPDFYSAYEEAGAVAPDWRDRADLYNLYHLLNHLNLFGGGYHGSVVRVLKRFS